MRTCMHALLSVVFGIAAIGCGDNIRSGPSIETRLDKNEYVAGEPVPATCEILDVAGNPMRGPDGALLSETAVLTITYQHADSFGEDEAGAVIAQRAGGATVRCAAPELGLVDESPEAIQIVPSAVVRIVTTLDAPSTYAGQAVGVRCLGFDAYNNQVGAFPYELAISPTGDGTTVATDAVTANIAGDYEVTCLATGVTTVDEAFLLVLPALPASIVARLEPERQIYAIDQQVTMIADTYDIFGNRVDEATFDYTSNPNIPSPSVARFQFAQDGNYSLTATVTSATHEDIPLSVTLPVLVNTRGPAIECMRADSPTEVSDAYMIMQPPSTLTVPVRVSDAFTVQTVTINGTPGTFDAASGNYRAGVPIGFGMNFVDVVATDEHGLENSTTCFILAASHFTGEGSHMDGALSLRMDQRAISDTDLAVLDSLNDILQLVIRSPLLVSLVDQGLSAANPINDGSCGLFACNPDVNYTAGSVSWGTPSSTLALISGGLQANVVLPNVRARVRACGTSCCPGGSDITVTVSSISASVNFSIFLQNGVLRAAVAGDPVVNVGTVTLNGSGFCGFVVNLVQGFFVGIIRDEIRDALKGFIASDLGPVLDNVVSSLDVNTLGSTFSVPRIDGTGHVDLGFGLMLSSLDITPTRLLLGLGTRFTPGAVAQNRPSLGIARRTSNPLLDPPGTNTTRPVGLAFYEGLLNQVLHGLWRGGFFQASLAIGDGSATIDAKLPAVVAFTAGNRANLMLGGIQATITVPGIISNLQVTFGGRASAGVSLVGNSLTFGNMTIDELYASFAKPLTQGQRDALEGFLAQVLQRVLIDAINDGLPAIPIPAFTLPASVGPYGLPAGAELGIVNPILSTSGSHFVLTGAFGRRN